MEKNNNKEELDKLLEAARFKAQFWAVIRRWAAWLTAIIVGAPTVLEALRKLWSEFTK